MGWRGQKSGRRLLAAAALAGLVLGAGLTAVARAQGSNDSAAEAAATPDYSDYEAVCALLTADDLRQGLGRSFGSQGRNGFGSSAFPRIAGVVKCFFVADEGLKVRIEIAVVHAYARQVFDETKAKRREGYEEPLLDISVGDEAFWFPAGGELLVLSGDKIFGVNSYAELHEPQADQAEKARRLAVKALERLD